MDRVPEWLKVYLKGVLMGAADTVPGVSGGTIALITGIYERLVNAIASIETSLLEGVYPPDPEKFREDLVERDVPFLLVLGTGVATSVILISRFMHFAISSYPGPTNALFLGLIGASAFVLYGEVALDSPGRIAAALTGFTAAFLFTGISGDGGVGHSFPVLFASGALASAAMILPGISGAAFLYILGQYEFLTGVLESFVDAAIGFSPASSFLSDAAVITVFLAGVTAGLLSLSKVVSRALQEYREATLTGLVSLMLGSLRLPAEQVLSNTGGSAAAVSSVLAAALVGAGVVLVIDRYTADLQY